jgi:hypothetical protein
VITEVPALTGVTTPVDVLMLATAVVAEDQDPPLTEELKVEVPLEQMAVVPEIVPAEGAVVTVTFLVAVAFGHPFAPVTVYVMVAVPAATPVIVPADADAILTFEEVQVPPETVEVNVVVDPTHTGCVPDKVPAEVAGLMVITILSVAVYVVPVTVIVSVTLPAVISAALGVYTAVFVVPAVNVPVPDVDHCIVPLLDDPAVV